MLQRGIFKGVQKFFDSDFTNEIASVNNQV